MTDKEKTEEIYKRLVLCHNNRNYTYLKELRIGTGYSAQSQRSIDFLTISTSYGNDVTVYEVKASKSDYKKDILDFEKQKAARAFANYFYYIAPRGIIDKNTLPSWAGLYEVDLDEEPIPYKDGFCSHGQARIIKTIRAPRMENIAPTWGVLASVIRNKGVLDNVAKD